MLKSGWKFSDARKPKQRTTITAPDAFGHPLEDSGATCASLRLLAQNAGIRYNHALIRGRFVDETTSFLRWAGSKRQLLPVLAAYWKQDHERYLEPFAGSACLFFQLAPRRAVLGDINAELIGTFWQIRKSAGAVASSLRSFRKSRSSYLRIRALDPKRLSPSKRAARFIYLNRYCFNGLWRTNRNGRFNVPYGGDKSGRLPTVRHLRLCAAHLSNATLIAGDFEEVLVRARKGDFVYLDPPFSVRGRRVFKEYDPAVFRAADVTRLRGWLERLADQKIDFLVSYASSEEASVLAKGFRRRYLSVKRNIAGFAGDRARATEVLISPK